MTNKTVKASEIKILYSKPASNFRGDENNDQGDKKDNDPDPATFDFRFHNLVT
jgi:hypothetical protein